MQSSKLGIIQKNLLVNIFLFVRTKPQILSAYLDKNAHTIILKIVKHVSNNDQLLSFMICFYYEIFLLYGK